MPRPEWVTQPLDGPGMKVADSRELLFGYLDWYRETLLRKLDGLSDELLRTPVEPLGWSPLGLVKHLGWVERRWMRWGFAAEEFGVDEPAERVLAAYHEEVRRSRELAGAAALTDVARLGGRFTTPEQAPPLARILFHLLQEYARHAGHLDIAPEIGRIRQLFANPVVSAPRAVGTGC